VACTAGYAVACVAAKRAHDAATAGYLARYRVANAATTGRLHAIAGLSPERAAAVLAGGEPLPRVTGDPDTQGRDVRRWFDATTYTSYDLIFAGGTRLIGWTARSSLRADRAQPGEPWVLAIRKTLTGLLLGFSIFGWIGWIAVVAAEPRLRWAAAHLALMVWVAATLTVVMPRAFGSGRDFPYIACAFGAFTLAVPAYAAVLDRRSRASPDVCRTCGYSLTGNISGTCPECGTRTDRAALLAERERTARAVAALERGSLHDA
jgi:hypothetical protein